MVQGAMRWVPFLLLVVIVLTLQAAVAPQLELLGARPDLLLVIVVFFALHARPRDAAIGAWVLGGCADLMTIERLGLLALSYGLIAVAVTSIRDYVFRSRPVTQFVVTLVTCMLLRTAWTAYRRVLYHPGDSLLVDLTIEVVTVSLYTAVLAPPTHMVLLRMMRTFGLSPPRYTYAGLHRIGTSGV